MLTEFNNEINEFDKEEILNTLSDEIMIDNLLGQIKLIKDNIIEDNSINDKLSYFINKYLFIVNKYKDNNEELVLKSKEIIDSILNKILDTINEVFSIKITLSEGLLFEDKLNYIQSLYNFLIINLSENIINFGYYYIIDNIESLKKSFKIKNKKNLSYLTIKKVIDNEYTPVILNTENILKSIRDITDEDVIYYLIRDDEEEVNNYYSKLILVDNYMSEVTFVEPFINFIRNIIKKSNKICFTVQYKLINKLKNIKEDNNDN